MPNLNRVLLIGHLTRDPELRYVPSGAAVCDVSLAINRRWKDKNGQQQEEVSFVDCVAWSKTAEVITQYLKKGAPLFVEGYLKQERWQTPDGQNRSRLRVIIQQFQFLGGKKEAADPAPAGAEATEDENIPF